MPNPKYGASRAHRGRFLPTPRDRRILEAVRAHTRLTREHVRRLFFQREGRLASPQAVNARLQKLAAHGYLEPVVVNGGRGAGPYAYGLGRTGRLMLQAPSGRPGAPGAVWHHLELAELRVRLQEALLAAGGELVEWLGDTQLRSLVRRRGWPVPDALVHWRLVGREGTFLLEWDRGTESLAVLAAKMARYADYWRSHGHRQLLPGLGLRPRLAVVLHSVERRERMVRWLLERRGERLAGTVLVGLALPVLTSPLGPVWWRSDTGRTGTLQD